MRILVGESRVLLGELCTRSATVGYGGFGGGKVRIARLRDFCLVAVAHATRDHDRIRLSILFPQENRGSEWIPQNLGEPRLVSTSGDADESEYQIACRRLCIRQATLATSAQTLRPGSECSRRRHAVHIARRLLVTDMPRSALSVKTLGILSALLARAWRAFLAAQAALLGRSPLLWRAYSRVTPPLFAAKSAGTRRIRASPAKGPPIQQVMMTMIGLSPVAGGITRVVVNRANMFSKAGIHTRIALLGWDPNLPSSLEQFRGCGRLSPAAEVTNLYWHYAARIDAEDADTPRRETSTPYPTQVAERDPTTGHITERHFSARGRCYLTRRAGASGGTLSIELLRENTSVPLIFRSLSDLNAFWLAELGQTQTPCVIIADSRASVASVLRVKKPGVFRILTLHGNHFAAPHNYGSPLGRHHEPVLKGFNKADALAVLTERQRQDLVKQFGRAESIYAIPNSATVFPDAVSIERDPHLVVAIAQYRRGKGLHNLIKAFKSVVHQVPQARLELHGSGDQEAVLRQLIAREGLEEVVFLKGYATDVGVLLRSAAVLVSASVSEGFGMTLVEALSQKTPVVSLDINYGPADIVRDGVDGYLVQDMEQLAARVVQLLRHPVKARVMGEAANVQRFSETAVCKAWFAMFEQLRKARRKRVDARS